MLKRLNIAVMLGGPSAEREVSLRSNIPKFASRILRLAMSAILVLGFGCKASAPTPDLLAGWSLEMDGQPSTAIDKDYHDYITSLNMPKTDFVGEVDWFKDTTGQHAIKIEIGINGTWWEHVLFYDKNGNRIKVIKREDGHYGESF